MWQTSFHHNSSLTDLKSNHNAFVEDSFLNWNCPLVMNRSHYSIGRVYGRNTNNSSRDIIHCIFVRSCSANLYTKLVRKFENVPYDFNKRICFCEFHRRWWVSKFPARRMKKKKNEIEAKYLKERGYIYAF